MLYYEEEFKEFTFSDWIKANPVKSIIILLVILGGIATGIYFIVQAVNSQKGITPATSKPVQASSVINVKLSKGVNSFKDALETQEALEYIQNFITDARNEGIANPYVNYDMPITINEMTDPNSVIQTISFKGGSKMLLSIPYKTDLVFDIPPKIYDSTVFSGEPTIESPKYSTSNWGDNEVFVLYQIIPVSNEWTYKEDIANNSVNSETDSYSTNSPRTLNNLYRYNSINVAKWVITNYGTAQLNIPIQELPFYSESGSYMSMFVLIANNDSLINDLDSRHGIRIDIKPELNYSINTISRSNAISLYSSPYMNYYLGSLSQVYQINWDYVQSLDTNDPLKRYIPLSFYKFSIDMSSIVSRTYKVWITKTLTKPIHVVQLLALKNDIVFNNIVISNYFINSTNPVTLNVPSSSINGVYTTTIIVFPSDDLDAPEESIFISASRS